MSDKPETEDGGSKMDSITVANPSLSLAVPSGGAAARRLSTFGQNCPSRSRSRSVGERQWGRVRAVMAMYTRLRQIKRQVFTVKACRSYDYGSHTSKQIGLMFRSCDVLLLFLFFIPDLVPSARLSLSLSLAPRKS
jgi:hypothetical protein